MEESGHRLIGRPHLLLKGHYLLLFALHALELAFLDLGILQIEVHLHCLHVVVFCLFEHFFPLFVLQDFLGVFVEEVLHAQLSSEEFLGNGLVSLVVQNQPLLSAKLDVGLSQLHTLVVDFLLQFLHEHRDHLEARNVTQRAKLLKQLLVELLPHFVWEIWFLLIIGGFLDALNFLRAVFPLIFHALHLFSLEDLFPVFPDFLGELLDFLGVGAFLVLRNFANFHMDFVFVEELQGDWDFL